MLNAQKAKLIIAACLSFFVGTFLALYTKNLPTFGAGVLVAAYFLVEFLTMLKNSKADKYIKVTALAVNADESRAGFEPMETWRFIPVNEDGEYLDKNGKYDIFLQVKPRDREYHIGALYDMSASALLSTVVRTRMRLSSLSAPRRSSSATPCVPSLPRVPAFWFPVVSSPATTRRMVRRSSMTI